MEKEDCIIELYTQAIKLCINDLHSYDLYIKDIKERDYKNVNWCERNINCFRKKILECWKFLYSKEIGLIFDVDFEQLVKKYFEMKGWDYSDEIKKQLLKI